MGHRAVWFVSGGADAVRFGLSIRAASELDPCCCEGGLGGMTGESTGDEREGEAGFRPLTPLSLPPPPRERDEGGGRPRPELWVGGDEILRMLTPPPSGQDATGYGRASYARSVAPTKRAGQVRSATIIIPTRSP